MPTVFERLRDGLAPDYELRREIGSGGMGIVFLAHEPSLDRLVAIKVLRPELATARAVERFRQEARTLAQVNHPNIVPVHRVDVADGIDYFVMDYLPGETLDQRLQRGPLPLEEVLRLGRDLLDGLQAVHEAGMIHRDIKPANIFRVGSRAVLGDFGLALPVVPSASAPTEPPGFVGTPGYVAPEQGLSGKVTPLTDLYAAGMVLYEAATGRHWDVPAPWAPGNWTGVPRELRDVLRRALAWSPERRWRDAAAFRRALPSGRTWPGKWRTVAITAGGGLVVGASVVALVLWLRPSERHATQSIRIVPFSVLGTVAPAAGDSLARLIVAHLAGSPDFRVVGGGASSADVDLRGTLRADGASRCAVATLQRSAGGPITPLPSVCVASGRWADLADSLAVLALLEVWTGREPLIADLPRRALPRTPWGIAAWARAEHLFIQGRWGEAHQAYAEAEQADSTCWLCSWRLSMTEDWMSITHDTLRTARYLAHADSFTPQYRILVRAKTLPIGPRLDSLRAATNRYPRFFFGWFMLGDELFHRGPLAGHSVDEAVQALERATELGPGFAPAWEHLAWAATEAGDSALARHALDRWNAAMGGAPRDSFSMGLVAMVEVGYAWRFLDRSVAEGLVSGYLQRPEIAGLHYLIEGPRYMPTFDAPRGAVWLGTQFAAPRWSVALHRSGLLARAFGYVSLGRPDSAQATLRALVERFPEPELALFACEYGGALAVADSAAVAADWRSRILTELRRRAAPEAGGPAERARARWMIALVSGDAGAFPEAAGAKRDVLEAWQLARVGHWREAIDRTDGLRLNPDSEPHDPTLRALLQLGRAEWYARLGGDPAAVRRELRWAEHEDVVGTLDVNPQAAEVDWSFRTLARWRLATELDRAGEQDDEVCDGYRRVAQLWAGGAPVYRARADSARRRLAEIPVCQSP